MLNRTCFYLLGVWLLSLSGCGGGSPMTVLSIAPSPASIAFASQTVGTAASPAENITLTNTGNTAVTVTGTTVSGTNSTAFSAVNTCASPLAVGASCTVTVTFTPNVIGANVGSLAIASSPAIQTTPVSLSGTGLAWTSPTWTWLSGSSAGNANGVYGTQGVAAAANVPGGRVNSVSWTDASGNLWLFGGTSLAATGDVAVSANDLWKYSPTTGLWTWISGSSTGNSNGVYGTQGVAAATNVPGGRADSVSWTDSSGNLWLFGGLGNDSAGTVGSLGDLWQFSPGTGLWTWVSGSNIANTAGIYGTLGLAAAGNVPGARSGSVSWTDTAGNLWLWGGGGNDSSGNDGGLNDLWKYGLASGLWTWISGSSVTLYGGAVCSTPGVPAAGNVPGAVAGASSWTDAAGNLRLFGGAGWNGNPGIFTNFNTLWTYNPTTALWTCSGPSTEGMYGTQNVAAASNLPPGRSGAVSWTDASGNLWLFGGAIVANIGGGELNDLWTFNTGTGLWTWVGGSQDANVLSSNCTSMGTPAGCNFPGGRTGSVSWIDAAGNLLLFGGSGLAANPAGPVSALENDLWKYSP
jgi:N-acetylneuraminic acid mutarotase